MSRILPYLADFLSGQSHPSISSLPSFLLPYFSAHATPGLPSAVEPTLLESIGSTLRGAAQFLNIVVKLPAQNPQGLKLGNSNLNLAE
jgi:hypothetical protein